jgi:hypothetical protein
MGSMVQRSGSLANNPRTTAQRPKPGHTPRKPIETNTSSMEPSLNGVPSQAQFSCIEGIGNKRAKQKLPTIRVRAIPIKSRAMLIKEHPKGTTLNDMIQPRSGGGTT